MTQKKSVFVIVGSAIANSSNHQLVKYLQEISKDAFHFLPLIDLKTLPHFDPILSSAENPPIEIQNFRQYIQQADAVIICTPEYIFSIPSGLKNALEWSVSTTIFSEKPTVLMTASADGQKGHAELILIMQTLSAKFDLSTTLLISGIKGKFNNEGEIIDSTLKQNLAELMNNLAEIVAK